MANTLDLFLTIIFTLSVCSGSANPLFNSTMTYKVGSILVEPFLMYREEGHFGGDPEYEGYIPDLLHELSERLGVHFKVVLTPDKRFGDQQTDGHWDGMVGTLIRREVDIGAGPLTITSRRGRVIDFSKPFMSTGLVMAMSGSIAKDQESAPSVSHVSLVVKPFTPVAWCMLVAAIILIGVAVFIVNRLSPHEEKLVSCGGQYSGLVVRSTLVLFGVLIVVLYTAGVVSLLLFTARVENSMHREQDRKDSEEFGIDDVVQSQKYKIIIVRDGSSQAFLRHSSVPVYHRAYERVEYVDNVTQGFDLVLKDPSYVFITDSPLADYYLSRKPYCSLARAGNPLNSNGYGLAYPINSQLHDLINLSILEMMETGLLQRLHRKWWHGRDQCHRTTPPSKMKTTRVTPGVDGTTVGGVLVVLSIGLLLAGIVGVVERVLQKKSAKVNVGNQRRQESDGQPLHLGGATNRELGTT